MYEIREFRIPGVVKIVLYRDDICNTIRYSIPTRLHKTRRWFYTPFSLYTFENYSSKPSSGGEDQNGY